jgi:hypothetical protein
MTWPAVDVGTSPFAFSMEGSGRIFISLGVLTVLLFNPANQNLVTDNGQPLTYHVIEHFRGGQQYDITFDLSTAQGAFLSSVIVPGSIQPFQFEPMDPMGDMLPPLATPAPVPAPAIRWIPAVSTEYLRADITAITAGNNLPVDPTGDAIYFAFTAVGAEPLSGDWHTAGWESSGPPYVARILLGPGGLALAQGKYAIWFKIVDLPETPVIPLGTLYIT